jgi:toxin HigB-1
MIKNFADKETERLWVTGKSRRLPATIIQRALMRLLQIHAAVLVDDLRLPPSNQLEVLQGNRRGQWSIRINAQWRICFSFEGGNAHDVEIIDYH